MDTIKLFWLYFRNALGAVSLLWPIALAAWVFHMALGLGDAGGLWLAILGAGAVLVFFRSYWRLWAILFPEVWRWSRPLRDNLTYWAARKIQAGLWRIRTDWNDLRRALK